MPSNKPTLKQTAESNPTQLGDPVSLKAETSNTEPTEHDRGARGSGPGDPSLAERAERNLKENPSLLGDPISLKSETSKEDPVDHDNGPSGERGSGRSKL